MSNSTQLSQLLAIISRAASEAIPDQLNDCMHMCFINQRSWLMLGFFHNPSECHRLENIRKMAGVVGITQQKLLWSMALSACLYFRQQNTSDPTSIQFNEIKFWSPKTTVFGAFGPYNNSDLTSVWFVGNETSNIHTISLSLWHVLRVHGSMWIVLRLWHSVIQRTVSIIHPLNANGPTREDRQRRSISH